MRTRIKICGLTREQDVEDVIDAGVDALGFVFYEQSPRFVSPKRVRQMIDLCPPWVHKVGLFVNATKEEVLKASEISGINQIQLHGNESYEHCKNIGLPVIKAVRVGKKCNLENNNEKQTSQLLESKRYLDFCDAVLLDSFSDGFGGSGESFDWSILKNANSIFGKKWVLSGGLNSQNVCRAIRSYNPPGVDVSSGVEQLIEGKKLKGKKDKKLVYEFVKTISLANSKKDFESE